MVDLIEEEWGALGALGATLEEREWALPSECPGWTVKDLVSHMVGTERSLLGEDDPPELAGTPPHVHNDIGASNERWVHERRSRPGREVLAEFVEVTGRRLEVLRSMEPAGFDVVGPSPVGHVQYREYMAVRVMDCWVHEQDIRVATGRPGHATGPAARLALDRIASAMPYVVGRRAGAPGGASVRFDILDEPPWVLDVVVEDGRAVARPISDPILVLHMNAEVFWRLACGRVSGDAALGAQLVGIDGDEGLGHRIVSHMAFMI
ncbi:MAG: maleylpyruvate isomerase family mycothiol-dependent enzyme [Acidimicrobiales bacterium]